KGDFLVVHIGRLFGHDAYIPRAAIEGADADGVHLRVRKGELKELNQTPLPEPTAPIRHNTSAPEATAADEPRTAPMPAPGMSGFPALEMGMGAAAVAATAFSHDTTAPVSSAPVPSAGGTAQDAAGNAGEPARQGVEQLGPLLDQMRERVGPIAEQ